MSGIDDFADDFVPDDTYPISDDDEVTHDSPQLDPAVPGVSVPDQAKKRKRREKEKQRKKRKLAEVSIKNEGLSTAQTPSEAAAYLSTMLKKTFPKYTELEFDDIRIPESSIVDTSAWTEPRTLDTLVAFILQELPTLHKRLLKQPGTKGTPSMLYIAGAALRVADVTRVLKNKKLRGRDGGDVAKLFARHFKLAEHVTYLKRTHVSAAVGTPGRLGSLLNETESLHLSGLLYIFLDITHRDAKNRNLLDIPETRDEVFKSVLTYPPLLKRIREGQTQIILF